MCVSCIHKQASIGNNSCPLCRVSIGDTEDVAATQSQETYADMHAIMQPDERAMSPAQEDRRTRRRILPPSLHRTDSSFGSIRSLISFADIWSPLFPSWRPVYVSVNIFQTMETFMSFYGYDTTISPAPLQVFNEIPFLRAVARMPNASTALLGHYPNSVTGSADVNAVFTSAYKLMWLPAGFNMIPDVFPEAATREIRDVYAIRDIRTFVRRQELVLVNLYDDVMKFIKASGFLVDEFDMQSRAGRFCSDLQTISRLDMRDAFDLTTFRSQITLNRMNRATLLHCEKMNMLTFIGGKADNIATGGTQWAFAVEHSIAQLVDGQIKSIRLGTIFMSYETTGTTDAMTNRKCFYIPDPSVNITGCLFYFHSQFNFPVRTVHYI